MNMVEINKSLLQGIVPHEKCVFGESWSPGKSVFPVIIAAWGTSNYPLEIENL